MNETNAIGTKAEGALATLPEVHVPALDQTEALVAPTTFKESAAPEEGAAAEALGCSVQSPTLREGGAPADSPAFKGGGAPELATLAAARLDADQVPTRV